MMIMVSAESEFYVAMYKKISSQQTTAIHTQALTLHIIIRVLGASTDFDDDAYCYI